MSYILEAAPKSDSYLNSPENPIYIGGEKGKPGEVICVRGVYVTVPKPPFQRSISNWNRKVENQYWERTDFSGFEDMSKEEQEIFLDEEFDKIENGYWFYNDGEPTYLTGQHYYYLNYIKLDIGYPEFRYRDLFFFYFWEASVRHPKSYGVTMTKPRRMGASWIAVGILLRDVTRMREALGGILSKTGLDAKKFFTRKLVRAYRDLPSFLRPENASGTNPKSSLDFTETSIRSKETLKNKKSNTTTTLNSYIEWRNTSENSFDSEKVYRLVYDEIGKIEERIDLNDQLDTILRCMYDNGEIIGKCFAPSTINRMERGGGQYKEVYYASKFSETIEEATPTGLWAYFVPAYDGLGGFIDKYGKSIIEVKKGQRYYDRFNKPIVEGSLNYLKTKRKLAAKKGPSALIEEKRKMPFNELEAFYFQQDDGVLDAGRIQMQIDHNESMLRLPVQRGDFHWADEPFGKVRFEPSENGKFLVSWMPPPQMQNRWLFKGNKKVPANQHMVRGGADPFAVDVALYGGSKGGFHLKTTALAADGVPVLTTILEYVFRPPLARIFSEDVLKACIFYGASLLCESNIKNLIDYFEENGFTYYLIDRPSFTYGKNASRSLKKEKGIPTATQNVIMHHLEMLNIGILEEIGENESGKMGEFPFMKTLSQLQQYNLANRSALDSVVSWGYANVAVHLGLNEIKERNKSSVPLLNTYKRGGKFYYRRYQ